MSTMTESSVRAPFGVRPLIPLLLAPLVALGLAAAYTSMRSTFFELWMATGLDDVEVAFSAVSSGTTWGMWGALLLALVVGSLAGGWATTLTGTFLLAIGTFLVGPLVEVTVDYGETHPVVWAIFLASLGRTTAGIGLFVIVLDAARGRRAWLALASIAMTYAAYNLGATAGYLVQSGIVSSGGFNSAGLVRMVLLAGTTVAVVDFLLVLGGAIAWWMLGKSRPEPDPRRRTVYAAPLLLGLLLAVVVGIAMGAWWVAAEHVVYGPFYRMTQTTELGQINPVLVSLVCVGLAVAGVVFHLLGSPTAALPLLPVALGGVLLVAGIGVAALGGETGLLGGIAITSVAEALVIPAAYLAFGRGLHWRLLVPVFVVHRLLERGLVDGVIALELPEGEDTVLAVALSVTVTISLCTLVAVVLGIIGRKVWALPEELAPTPDPGAA